MIEMPSIAKTVVDRLTSLPEESSFALIRRLDEATVDILIGTAQECEHLADIPLDGSEVVALVPFRQVRERGFDAIDDGAPLLALVVTESLSVPADALIDALPDGQPALEEIGFDLSDDQYAAVAADVIRQEIGRGEGANFVIRRDYRARTQVAPRAAILAWLRRLLVGEQGAYWTFAYSTPAVSVVGASPERHVSSRSGTVMMNPISGTLRHSDFSPDVAELLTFLADRKESEELVMVVDEELKMMSAVCPTGGVMRGPFLKPMSKLTHTEYLLEGKSDLDPREILRQTMFAPTVTGSPMENACRVIARHENSGRGYYSGVLARFTPTSDGYDLDAPILIRTAVVKPNREVTVSAGATLVRHSDPYSEAEETRAKASGVLTALGVLENVNSGPSGVAEGAASAPQVLEALKDRNALLAPFWRDEQQVVATFGARVLVVDCEDDFTNMLAHQLRRLGLTAHIEPWDEVSEVSDWDLVVFGPGPGDPLSTTDKRIVRLRELVAQRVCQPMIAVCLSHQILSSLAGLDIVQLPVPRQGQPLDVEIMGKEARIGFYNTFSAIGEDGGRTPEWSLRIHSEPATGYVHSLTGPNLASVQGHLESVLSYDGFAALTRLVAHVLV